MEKCTCKNANIKASIIIPVYNAEKYLRRCLDSVLSQTYDNLEIICIDDCSTDGSPMILEEYKKNNINVTVLYNLENIGQGKSRMKGIAAAHGEYILFVDSDDYLDENYVSTYMRAIVRSEYDVVVGGFIKDEGTKKFVHLVDSNIGSIISYSHACCKMYRREFVVNNNISFGDFRKGEDIYFSLMLVLNDAKHCFIDYCGYYYYLNDSSTTKTMNYTTDFERIVSRMFDKILEENKDLNKKQQRYLEYAYVAGMVNALIVYNKGCPIKAYMDKYEFFKKDLCYKFNNYKNNKLLFRWQMSGPSLKCRLGVWLTMNCMRLRMDRFMYRMLAATNSIL